MKNKIIAGKLISILKINLFIILFFSINTVYAEYYVAYTAIIGGCQTPCCETPCQKVVPCKKYKSYHKKHCSIHKPKSRATITTYYVWPMYAGTLWVPACSSGCPEWHPGYCRTMDCRDFYIPPQYIRPSSEDVWMDMRTADDF